MSERPSEVREGKIKWFGYRNSQIESEISYGFIEDPEIGDIFFHKRQVNQDDIKYIDKNLMVNYEIQLDTQKNKYYAVRVMAKRNVAISSEKPYILYKYFLKAERGRTSPFKLQKLNPHLSSDWQKIINYAKTLNRVEDFSKVINYLISYEANDGLDNLFNSFFDSYKSAKAREEIWIELVLLNPDLLKVFPECILYLTEEAIFNLFHNPIALKLDNWLIVQLLNRFLETQANAEKLEKLNVSIFSNLVEYPDTWHYLSTVGLARLYLSANNSFTEDDKDHFLGILLQKIEDEPTANHTQAWKGVELLHQSVEYYGYLWDIAPKFVKIEVIRTRFSKFLKLVEDWKNYQPQHLSTTKVSCNDAYQFTDEDRKLVSSWTNGGEGFICNKTFFLSAMYSARGAEKAAIIHYKRRGVRVSDVSIQQGKGLSEDWKLYDLKVEYENKQKFIDVKNARSSSSNTNRFREFCVPRFKTRNNDEIKILGIFSPYVSNLPGAYKGNAVIKVLGEMQYSKLQTLQERCGKLIRDLEITISRTSNLKPQYLSEYLPPWIFDFDSEFYSSRHEIEERYKNLSDEEIPPLSELSLLDLSPLSLALCAKRQFPQHWELELEPSILRFSQILNFLVGDENNHLTLSHLFLAILIHFLEGCLNPDLDFSPDTYRKLIFTDSPMTMGICDPISVIVDVCQVLKKVWETCADQLNNFSYFKFDSKELLQGYNKKTDTFSTIIAYCGGWKKDEEGRRVFPCGNEPLYIGLHKTCPACKKLICNACHFCSRDCENLPSLRDE